MSRPLRVGLVASRPRRRARGVTARSPLFQAFVSSEVAGTERIKAIRNGIAAGVVDGMVDYLDVPKRTIFNLLHAAESTTHRLIKEKGTLDSAATERVLRVADITRLAIATFGDRPAAARWLRTENRGLGGVAPLSLLDSEVGGTEVRRVLSAITYGGAF